MHFLWKVRIYYEDTDAGGVVYHARYLAFMERARTEMLRHSEIEQQSLLGNHLAFVVSKLNINYLLPAKLDDELTVETRIIQLKAASLIFEQQIFNQRDQHIAQAEVCVAMVDLNKMKPIRVPHTILSRFKLWMD